MPRRLVILDRDGVINHDSDEFIKSPDEWQPIEGSLEAMGALTAAGFTVAVATNQSGLGRKILDRPALVSIHDKMRTAARTHGGDIDRIVCCPHHPDDGCECRKPKPGLLTQLARFYSVPLLDVPVIGDSMRDLEAAAAVGARPILVLTGNGAATAAVAEERLQNLETFADLSDAVAFLIAEAGSGSDPLSGSTA